MIVMVSTTNTASAGTNPLRCFAVIGLIVMGSKANEYSMSTTHATEAENFLADSIQRDSKRNFPALLKVERRLNTY